ncbi:translation initiation factor IF-2-like isoform X1 [Fundulus heteroclitus]|uniref:translation initiation factor IF-2-like isoform X1 n=1 Tax=Fundulus heteroclitus TaxID=8078 RepID=UPI00165ACE92|nr:translation initiation factor IF-2-like isoform X1 [Fundulus heteroclitus]
MLYYYNFHSFTSKGRGRCPQYPGGRCPGRFGPANPLPAGALGYNPAAVQGGSNIPVGLLPRQVSTSPGGAHRFPAGQLSQPNNGAPVLDGRVPVSSPTNGATDGKLNIQLVVTPVNLGLSGPSQG